MAPKTVSVRFRNAIKPDSFDFTLELSYKKGTSLFEYMQNGSVEYQQLLKKFTCTFYPSVPGFLIDAINDVYGNYTVDKTYWRIYRNGTPSPVGVCDLVPCDEDVIFFDLYQASDDEKHDLLVEM